MKRAMLALAAALAATAAWAQPGPSPEELERHMEKERMRPPHRDIPGEGLPDSMGVPEEMGEVEDRRMLGRIKEFAPELYDELSGMWNRDSRRFRRMFARHLTDLRHAARDPKAREKVIERVRSQMRAHQLVQKYRETEDAKEKAALKPKIRQGLGEVFDAQLEVQELQVERMEKELKDLRSKIAKRRKNRSEIIDRKLDEVTGEEESFEW